MTIPGGNVHAEEEWMNHVHTHTHVTWVTSDLLLCQHRLTKLQPKQKSSQLNLSHRRQLHTGHDPFGCWQPEPKSCHVCTVFIKSVEYKVPDNICRRWFNEKSLEYLPAISFPSFLPSRSLIHWFLAKINNNHTQMMMWKERCSQIVTWSHLALWRRPSRPRPVSAETLPPRGHVT